VFGFEVAFSVACEREDANMPHGCSSLLWIVTLDVNFGMIRLERLRKLINGVTMSPRTLVGM